MVIKEKGWSEKRAEVRLEKEVSLHENATTSHIR